jgi:hypothetical protein
MNTCTRFVYSAILMLCLPMLSWSQDGCACTNQYEDHICDNFELYSTSQRLGPQSACWTTWSGNEGGSEDGRILSSSGDKYLYIQGTSSSGGAQDVVMQLGNRNEGSYAIHFSMWVNYGRKAYYNLLHQFSTTGPDQWAYEVYFDTNYGYLRVGGNNYYFEYDQNTWVPITQYIDIETNRARLYVDGNFVHQWTFTYQPHTTSSGLNQLAALNFYPLNTSYRYRIDDIYMNYYAPGCFDIYDVNPGAYCTLEYNPVCGCNGVEYPNPCFAQIDGVQYWDSGSCDEQCQGPENPYLYCTNEIAWVCGCDGQTYANSCYAERAGINDWTYGQCNNTPCVDPNVIPDDEQYCIQLYDPVCGCNGVEYSNSCYALYAGVTEWTDGPCYQQECGYDPYEPNNYAYPLSNGGNHYGLICPIGDYDWFYIQTTNARPKLKATLTSLPADYDLYLYNSSGNLLDYSTNGGTFSEEVIYNGSEVGALYFIRVLGYGSAWSPNDTYCISGEWGAYNYFMPPSGNFDETNIEQRGHNKEGLTGDVEMPALESTSGSINLSVAPNPVKDNASFIFNIPTAGVVSVEVLDIKGRVVAQLLDKQTMDEGEHRINFDAGHLLPGVYLCRLSTASEVKTVKVVVTN